MVARIREGGGEGGGRHGERVAQGIWVMGLFCVLTVVVITWIYTCDKIIWPKTTHTHTHTRMHTRPSVFKTGEIRIRLMICTNVNFLVMRETGRRAYMRYISLRYFLQTWESTIITKSIFKKPKVLSLSFEEETNSPPNNRNPRNIN